MMIIDNSYNFWKKRERNLFNLKKEFHLIHCQVKYWQCYLWIIKWMNAADNIVGLLNTNIQNGVCMRWVTQIYRRPASNYLICTYTTMGWVARWNSLHYEIQFFSPFVKVHFHCRLQSAFFFIMRMWPSSTV